MDKLKVEILSQGMWKENKNVFAINLMATGANKAVKATVLIGQWVSIYYTGEFDVIPLELYTPKETLKKVYIDNEQESSVKEQLMNAVYHRLY